MITRAQKLSFASISGSILHLLAFAALARADALPLESFCKAGPAGTDCREAPEVIPEGSGTFIGSDLRQTLWRCTPELRHDQFDFSGANLNHARFMTVNGKTNGSPSCHFENADLSGAKVNQVDGSGLELVAANLSKIYFKDNSADEDAVSIFSAHMNECSFEDSQLDEMQIRGATLTESQFNDTSMKNTLFLKSDLSRSTFSSRSARNDTLLYNSAFRDKTQLEGARFIRLKPSHVSFKDVNLRNCSFKDSSDFGPEVSFKQSDLSGCDFSGRNLNTTWMEAVNLVGTNFSKADLTNVDFQNVTEARGVNFSGAVMGIKSFRGMDLEGADFTGVDLTQVDFTGVKSLRRVNFTRANLSGVNLQYLDARGANFTGATVTSSKLSRIRLDYLTRVGSIDFDTAMPEFRESEQPPASPEVTSNLLNWVSGNSRQARILAMKGLCSYQLHAVNQDSSIISGLLRIILVPENAFEFSETAEQIAAVIATQGAAAGDSLQPWFKALKDPDQNVRMTAYHLVDVFTDRIGTESGPAFRPAVQGLINGLMIGDSIQRVCAILLGKMGSSAREALGPLNDVLKWTAPGNRTELLRAITSIQKGSR
ncbi:MAG: pentapeptide repeat-containing protein [Methylotenera sp.]|nr:pentapeptide repeat-containing protein [Oligoflexia bacterium]